MHNQPFSIFQPAEFLLPDNTDLQKWAVIACDQHTSEPEYWQNISDLVGSSPSTLRMMIPEHLYTEPDLPERIRSTHDSMASYLEQGLFRTISPCYIYIERTLSNGKIRRGILGAIDLEQYDYHADSSAMIRATEGTVAEKLPARITIRTGAPLELSHVMVLADDPKQLLLDPLTAQRDSMELLYDFPLMEGGGHIRGYRADGAFAEHIASVLARFAAPDYFNQRYSLKGQAPMVLATGDGNHSLATAKARWETIKTGLTEEARQTHPARFSMVELINIH
ncbi:MAG: DUF1015 family protein, partial [Firmicutes bacterium]|nr:DUF1015 family protein [Bacillota bacterium]